MEPKTETTRAGRGRNDVLTHTHTHLLKKVRSGRQDSGVIYIACWLGLHRSPSLVCLLGDGDVGYSGKGGGKLGCFGIAKATRTWRRVLRAPRVPGAPGVKPKKVVSHLTPKRGSLLAPPRRPD